MLKYDVRQLKCQHFRSDNRWLNDIMDT